MRGAAADGQLGNSHLRDYHGEPVALATVAGEPTECRGQVPRCRWSWLRGNCWNAFRVVYGEVINDNSIQVQGLLSGGLLPGAA